MGKLNWNCKQRGKCYVERCAKLIEFLDDALPGGREFGDIDGCTVKGTAGRNGGALMIEYKSPGGQLTRGQVWQFEVITSLSPKIVALVITGPIEMESGEVCFVVEEWRGGGVHQQHGPKPAEWILRWIQDWAKTE